MGSVKTKSLILPLPKSPGFSILPSSQLVLGKDNWEEGKEGGRDFAKVTEESSFVPQGSSHTPSCKRQLQPRFRTSPD